MNKTLTFFTAPITALFYPPVYKDAAKSPAWRGVLYCLYLAGLATAILSIFLFVKVRPEADAFVKWTQANMPVLIWTPAGLSFEDGKTSAELTHPKYGKIALFDMTKTDVTEADFGGAYLFVTSSKVFSKQPQAPIEARDITGAAMRPGQQLPPKVRIDGVMTGKLYQNVKSSMAFVGIFMLLIVFFIFLMIMNLLYSLVGLLLNLTRKERIGYGAILNLTCFATGVSLTLGGMKALSPLRAMPWPSFVSILISLVYMFYAFKVTDKKTEE